MKGILMKSWKAKAIGESSPDFEWQTRRLDHLKEINQEPDKWLSPIYDGGYDAWAFMTENATQKVIVKPHYKVGEVVYIKEAWATENQYNHLKPSEIPHTAKIFYLSDGDYDPFKMGKVRSPLFLREVFPRHFIKITDVRPERLLEITAWDCLQEGLEAGTDIIKRYAELWDSINPKYPWSSNPWDFVYSFVKVDREVKR